MKDVLLVLVGALVQAGSIVLALCLGFGLQVQSWGWVGAGVLGVVFGRMAVMTVVEGASRG